MRCVAVVILIDLSLSSILTFVMHLFAVKPVAYIWSLGRWQVVGFSFEWCYCLRSNFSLRVVSYFCEKFMSDQ